MRQFIDDSRTMFLFRGLAAILFGALTFVWPKMTLSALVLLFGIFAIISGITTVAAALRNTKEKGWGFVLFEGIVGIAAGVVALVWPGITALAFLFLIAAWAIMIGIAQLVAPLAFPMQTGRALLTVLSGILSILFGAVMAAQPASGLLAIVWMIGLYAILVGITYLVVYFQSRALEARMA